MEGVTMSGQSKDTDGEDRRDQDRRRIQARIDGPDRRQSDRRSGADRRSSPRTS